ncbi:MAG: amidohydrolase, partial [Pseudodonghicola sp.]
MSSPTGVIAEIKADEQSFIDLRRQIHRHPELGFEETVTSSLVAEKLAEWGYEVTTGLGVTGV